MNWAGGAWKKWRWLFVAAGLLAGGPHSPAASVTVFAAASLTVSLREIAVAYEQLTGDKIILNLGASRTLAWQIEAGAPADIFFSADEAMADALEQQGLLVKGTRQSRLSNVLVIVVTPEGALAIHSARDLADAKVKRIAMGDPKTVPNGLYFRRYLEKLQLWAAVAPKVLPTDNVRAALAAVEAGNADAGMVYKTDAASSKKVKVAWEVPRGEGPKISYSMALVKDAPQPAAAKKFLAFLASEKAGRVFAKSGFIVLETLEDEGLRQPQNS